MMKAEGIAIFRLSLKALYKDLINDCTERRTYRHQFSPATVCSECPRNFGATTLGAWLDYQLSVNVSAGLGMTKNSSRTHLVR